MFAYPWYQDTVEILKGYPNISVVNALIDMNSSDMQAKAGEPIVAMHRAAELAMLLSKEFQGMVKAKKCNWLLTGTL